MEKFYLVEDGKGNIIGAFKSFKKALKAAEDEIRRVAEASGWNKDELNREIDLLYKNNYSDYIIEINFPYKNNYSGYITEIHTLD